MNKSRPSQASSQCLHNLSRFFAAQPARLSLWLLFVLNLISTASGSETLVLKRYTDGQGNYGGDGVTITRNMVFGATLPAGVYWMKFAGGQWLQYSKDNGVGSTFTIPFSNFVASYAYSGGFPAYVFAYGSNPGDPPTEIHAGTQGGELVPFEINGTQYLTQTTESAAQPFPSTAHTRTVTIDIAGAPIAESVKMRLGLSILPAAGFDGVRGGETVTLNIGGAAVATMTVPAETPGQLPNNIDLTWEAGVFEIVGTQAFTYTVNGTVVYSGTVTGGTPPEVMRTILALSSYTEGQGEEPPPIVTDADTLNGDGTTTTTTTATDAEGNTTTTQTTDGWGGGGTVNKKDFYEAMYHALMDAAGTTGGPGNGDGGGDEEEGTFTPPGSGTEPDAAQIDTDNRGKLDEIQGVLEQGQTAVADVKTGMQGKFSTLSDKVQTIPTSFGQLGSYTLGTLSGHGINQAITLDFSSFGGAISNLRTAMLFVMTIGWIALCVQSIKGYL